jgi:two-component system cell cycle sensor histidine kinase/response regulator CckA
MDLNQVVLDMRDVLDWIVCEDIDYVTSLDPPGYPIKADRHQIEQILLIVALNAKDAMQRGGRLMFGTTTVAVSEVPPGIDASYGGSPQILLSVTATGGCISNEMRPCILNRHPTTAEWADTSWGMSEVSQLVALVGGATVDSQPGTLDIYFPRITKEVIAEEPCSPERPVQNRTAMLVVENEEVVGGTVCPILTGYGYVVPSAKNEADAFRIAEDSQHDITLVIVHLVLPASGVMNVVGHFITLRPETKVLMISDYNDEKQLQREHSFLRKPFKPSDLVAKLRDLLPPRLYQGKCS